MCVIGARDVGFRADQEIMPAQPSNTDTDVPIGYQALAVVSRSFECQNKLVYTIECQLLQLFQFSVCV